MNKIDDNLHSFEKWLQLKVDEFFEIGYDSVTVDDLAYYLTEYLWKRQVPKKQIECIDQIMQIKPNEYWDFILLETQVTNMKTLDQIDLCELF